MKNTIQKSALSTNLIALVFALCGTQLLHAQDDANLIKVTTLDQLSAIRYDLDGDGVVVFTTENPLDVSAGNVDDLAELSRYASQFTGGTYHTRVSGSDTPISDAPVKAVAAGTTYVYKLSMTYEGYELMNDLDFKNSSTNTDEFSIWAKGSTASDPVAEGWDPIGYYTSKSDNSPFNAIFEGNGHTVSNLYINRLSTSNVGFFSYVSRDSPELRNIGLLGVEVTGERIVGGLVGFNSGNISGSYATGSVTGDDYVGGLVGYNGNPGDISGSYATGAVTGTGDHVGGLVGGNEEGTVSGSYATGAVRGLDIVGGLVGGSSGDISDSYATGAMTGNDYVGGLVGYNSNLGIYPIVMRRAW